MKTTKMKLISELMKNSRRSDRDLAKTIGVSQPTVSRLIKKHEKEGVIKEYTTIPGFRKFGFELLVFTLVKLEKFLSSEEIEGQGTHQANLEDNAYSSCHARKKYWNQL